MHYLKITLIHICTQSYTYAILHTYTLCHTHAVTNHVNSLQIKVNWNKIIMPSKLLMQRAKRITYIFKPLIFSFASRIKYNSSISRGGNFGLHKSLNAYRPFSWKSFVFPFEISIYFYRSRINHVQRGKERRGERDWETHKVSGTCFCTTYSLLICVQILHRTIVYLPMKEFLNSLLFSKK